MHDRLNARLADQGVQRCRVVERHQLQAGIVAPEAGDIDRRDPVPACRQGGPQRHSDQAGGAGEQNVHDRASPVGAGGLNIASAAGDMPDKSGNV